MLKHGVCRLTGNPVLKFGHKSAMFEDFNPLPEL